MNELALFAGAGGGILGGKLIGWRTVCAVELDAYAAAVLAQRQNDGCLEPFPIWSDITTFDGRPWRGIVDVVSGGFPCQDISCAGRGEGITGERSGLWSEMYRVVCEVGPRFVLVENSPMLTSRGLGVVLGNLAEMGFNAEWGMLGAVDAGAPHKRERIWIMAYSIGAGLEGYTGDGAGGFRQVGEVQEPDRPACASRLRSGERHVSNAKINGCGSRRPRRPYSGGLWQQQQALQVFTDADKIGWMRRPWMQREGGRKQFTNGSWWFIEPELGRVAHGVAHRVDRLKAIGNGQVPAVVRLAWETLNGHFIPRTI
jgi:DNA (cytosine-5)-methyltransferase 1